MHETIDKYLAAYVSGDISSEEMKELYNWVQESAENAEYVRLRLNVSWPADDTLFGKEEAYNRFKQRIALQTKQRFPALRILLRIAAIALLLLLPLAGYFSGRQSLNNEFADIVIEAPLGAQTKLLLPDGSQVWLNAGSKLTYSQAFGVSDRMLTFEGEGYFEVEKNPDKPFLIHTEGLNLKVIGTKFNFRNYVDDEEATVNLLEGKVELHNELQTSPDMILMPNDKAVLNKKTGALSRTQINATASNLWTQDELYFDELLIEDIAKQLSRAYGVKINVAPELSQKRFYGSFSIKGNTIENILSTIAKTGCIRYEKRNNEYYIYKSN